MNMVLFIIYCIFFVVGIVALMMHGNKMCFGEIMFFGALIIFSALMIYCSLAIERGGGVIL